MQNNEKTSLLTKIGNNYKNFWKKSFDTKSRASRSEWWTSFFINHLIGLAIPPAWSIIAALTFIPSFTQNIRRGNDIGWSKRNSVIAFVVPYILAIIGVFTIYFSYGYALTTLLTAFIWWGITMVRAGFEESKQNINLENLGDKEFDFFSYKEIEKNR